MATTALEDPSMTKTRQLSLMGLQKFPLIVTKILLVEGFTLSPNTLAKQHVVATTVLEEPSMTET
jgi:hypothetical protein